MRIDKLLKKKDLTNKELEQVKSKYHYNQNSIDASYDDLGNYIINFRLSLICPAILGVTYALAPQLVLVVAAIYEFLSAATFRLFNPDEDDMPMGGVGILFGTIIPFIVGITGIPFALIDILIHELQNKKIKASGLLDKEYNEEELDNILIRINEIAEKSKHLDKSMRLENLQALRDVLDRYNSIEGSRDLNVTKDEIRQEVIDRLNDIEFGIKKELDKTQRSSLSNVRSYKNDYTKDEDFSLKL